jgi:hypothetical protein
VRLLAASSRPLPHNFVSACSHFAAVVCLRVLGMSLSEDCKSSLEGSALASPTFHSAKVLFCSVSFVIAEQAYKFFFAMGDLLDGDVRVKPMGIIDYARGKDLDPVC